MRARRLAHVDGRRHRLVRLTVDADANAPHALGSDTGRCPQRERRIDRRVIEAATGVRLVAQLGEFVMLAETLAQHVAVAAISKVHAQESVGAFEGRLRAAHAASRELHRDERGLRGEPRLHPLGQRTVARHLMIAGDLRVHDAERVDHLRDVEPEHASRRDGCGKVTEQRRVHEAALDDADLRRNAKPADRFEPGGDRGDEVAASRAASPLGRGERSGDDRHARVQDGGIVRVVVVARMRHRSVDPRRVMRRNLVAEREDRRLGRARPFEGKLARLGDAARARAGDGAGERVEYVGLCGGDHGRGQVPEREPACEAGENQGEVVVRNRCDAAGTTFIAGGRE